MRGFLLAVAFVATLAISAAIDEECVKRKELGLPVHWPNPTDCSSFYRCTNKNIKRELLCPEGKEYNPKTGRCSNKGKNLCQLSLIAPMAAALDNPCAEEVSGTFVADPKSCRSYSICNNNMAYPQICDAGSYFKNELAACVPDTENVCWENLCVKKANGLYVANANDCHSFYICNDEKAVAQTCPTGSYFNAESLNCQPGKCPSEENDTTTCAPETTTTPCEVETTTTCAVPEVTTTTCVPETTTTPCEVETTTTCAVPEETTTTCAPETTTTPCEVETTTTCAAPEETTTPYCEAETTTTCAASEETTTLASNEDDCSNLNCETDKCKNAKDGFVYPALNTDAGFCLCQKQKPQYRECPDGAIYHQTLQICVAQDKVCPSSECLQKPDYTTFPASNTTSGFCRCLDGLASYFECVESDFVYSEELGFCVKAPSSNGDDCEEETDKLCPGGYSEGDFVPNPDNCMLFYICYEGELVETSCETGNYYDDQIKACLPDSEGKCPDCQVAQTSAARRRNRRSARAPNCVEGVKSPADNCTQYYKCVNGQRLLYGCGKGNFFNPITLTCEFDVEHLCLDVDACVDGTKTPYPMDNEKYYECVKGLQILMSCDEDTHFDKLSMTCIANEVCTCPGGYKEGQISAHPDDCDKFYMCIAGEQMIHDCGKGNYFNKDTLKCEKDVKNICNVDKPYECPGGYAEGEMSPHPKDCDKFYICIEGKQELMSCGENNYFDKETAECVPDIYHECWADTACTTCPGGYEEGQFSAHPTDCSKYYICHDGQQVLGDCGTNNYFNNDTLTCEPDMYHVCWPNLCAGRANGALVANPQQCNAFFLCENDEAIPNTCYEGQYFNDKTHACEADLLAVCYNPCENESIGPVVLLPHPICNKYYFCNGRKTHVGTCAVGSFDIKSGVCDETKKCFPNPCKNSSVIAFPDPYDPTKFYFCNGNREPIPRQCPAGKEFSVEYETCLPVSDPDCPVCTKDGNLPTLDKDNDYAFCVCVDGIGTKIECPKDYPYNQEAGICYSNAPCDPGFCLNNEDYKVAQNRNDSKSFCMCFNQKPISIECPNDGTFNPYTGKCSQYEMSPKCDQSKCVKKENDLKVFNPINTKTSNGVCICREQIATFTPCNYGSTLNPDLAICQLAEINCNSYQCNGLPDKTKIPALTTNEGYCECVNGVASYHNCPDNGEFNFTTGQCDPPICDFKKCQFPREQIPAANTNDGYCECFEGYKPCDEGEKFGKFGRCFKSCVDQLCTGKPDSYAIASTVNDNSFCVCHTGMSATYEECKSTDYIFDETKQRCVFDNKKLCGTEPCTVMGPQPAEGNVNGFCLCTKPGDLPEFKECLQGVFDETTKTCIKVAKDVCDISLCAAATMEHPITLPSSQSDLEFCYCSSPTNAMLLPCPNGKIYNHKKGMCVRELTDTESNLSCDDNKEGDKKAVTTTCNKYSICHDGLWQETTCPTGQYFNDDRKDCLLDTENICEKSDCTCLGAYYENERLPHPINKHMYYVCKDGKLHEHKCPAHRIFSDTQKQCVKGQLPDLPPATPKCDFKKCEFPKQEIAALNTNDGYCVCSEGYKDCPEGEKFGKYDRCFPPCVDQLCAGKPDLYAIESTVNDHSYCVCHAGRSATYKECQFTNYIFEETKQKCLPNSKNVCDISLCAEATKEHPITFPSSQSTSEYCYCSSPNVAVVLTCPEGKFYNQDKGKCDIECNVSCDSTNEGEKKAVTSTCNKYSLCHNGLWLEKSCPTGQYFDEVKKDCLPDTENICEKSDCTCLGAYYENERLPHPINKHMYYVCKDGMLHEHKCPAHGIFSPTQKQCIAAGSLGLRQKRSLDFSADHDEFGCTENEKRSVPSNCSQYEICLQQTWQRKTCSNYRYYNPEQKKCLEPRDDYVCSFAKVTSLPTCNASRELQLYEAKTCQQYYRCQAGKWQLKNCGRQMYFNKKLATCLPLPEDPGFQCSNQTLGIEANATTSCQHLSQRFYDKNCAMFLLCLDNEWWYQYCPEGMFYNRTLNYCEPDVKRQCKDVVKANPAPSAEEFSNDVCQQDGLLRPSAMACNRYFVCVNGKWQMQHCAPGEFYDVANAKCSSDTEGVCVDLRKDCLPNEKRSLPRNCSVYEQCSSEGKWLKLNCPPEQIFDELTQQCIKNQGICSKHGFKRACRREEIMPVQGNCSSFYYCSGDSWNLAKCAKDFMFAKDKQMCIAHKPEDKCQPMLKANFGELKEVEGLCFGKPDGTSVAHPRDCTRYYICIQQSTSHEMQCSKGSYFEPSQGYCRPNDGTCRLPLTGVCANATDESLVAHPSDCQSYYKCSSINGTELLLCPEGQYFHQPTKQCHLDQGECRTDVKSEKKCAGFAHGTRLPHEKYCNIYYACVKGLAIPIECPDNYQFNAILGKCMPDLDHQCQNGQLVEGNLSYSCGNLTDGSYLPDLKDCTRYYICSQGLALPKKCGNSSYFDSEQLLCVPDDGSCPFVNEDDGQQNPTAPDPVMCEGKHGYLMTDPFNCNNFYACIHNKLKHERCYDQQFFNTSTQQCQPKFLSEITGNSNTTVLELKTQSGKSQNAQCLDETISIQKLCTEMSQGTALAEPGDCRRYITCQEAGEEPVSQRCRNGESFDSLLGFCRQNDGTCLLENGQRVGECSGKHGQLARDPNNCRHYFVCINGQKIAQTCQPDEYFSKSQNMCLKDTQQVCNPISTPEEPQKQSCTGLSESVLYPYVHDNCRSYFQCLKGVAKIHKCADDLYFDPLTIKCVKNKTECIMPTNNFKRSPSVTQTYSKLCSNKKLEYPYPNMDNECRSFYICHNNGDISHELCPLGMIFNKELLTCTAENKTSCM